MMENWNKMVEEVRKEQNSLPPSLLSRWDEETVGVKRYIRHRKRNEGKRRCKEYKTSHGLTFGGAAQIYKRGDLNA